MRRKPDPLAPLKKRSHDQLVRAVVESCNRLRGVHLWRVDVGGARRAHGDAGIPDVIGWCTIPIGSTTVPVFVGFEVKTGRDTLRPSQQWFRDTLKIDHGIYAEVRSVEDAIQALR